MSRIDVVTDGKRVKVMVNYMQSGVLLATIGQANKEAQRLKDTDYPQADLHLMEVEPA